MKQATSKHHGCMSLHDGSAQADQEALSRAVFLTFRCLSDNLEVFYLKVQMPRAIKLEFVKMGFRYQLI